MYLSKGLSVSDSRVLRAYRPHAVIYTPMLMLPTGLSFPQGLSFALKTKFENEVPNPTDLSSLCTCHHLQRQSQTANPCGIEYANRRKAQPQRPTKLPSHPLESWQKQHNFRCFREHQLITFRRRPSKLIKKNHQSPCSLRYPPLPCQIID